MNVHDRAEGWIAGDPDPAARAELAQLLAQAKAGDAAADRELSDRFQGPLEFGTAGLRGLVGAGESRMNRAVVLRATFGLVAHVIRVVKDAKTRGIVIGGDARPTSHDLAIAAAEVAAYADLKVYYLPGTSPTPLVAFLVKHLGAAAGVTVTASHNPPQYNGYKVYLDRGAQIIPPHDQQIALQISRSPAARDVPRIELHKGLSEGLIIDATPYEEDYLKAVLGLLTVPVEGGRLRIAYTALHGVGDRFVRAAMTRAGFTQLSSEPSQSEPDGRFPTVAFPNPEEPAAMERVLSLGLKERADLVLANDPDADRLAVAAFDRQGQAVVLSGNEIGILLADHVLSRDPKPSPERLVVTTVVSSPQLAVMAKAAGVRYKEVLTGFKWIASGALDSEESEGSRFVFGYEEALGYTVGTVTRDKDGIGAALVMAELAALLKQKGQTLLDRLREIREKHGLYVSRQKSITLPGKEGAAQIKALMEGLRKKRLELIGTAKVESRWDLWAGERVWADGKKERVTMPSSDVLSYALQGGGRVAVRPSGTEPKVKLYFDVVQSLSGGEDLAAATTRGQTEIDGLEAAMLREMGLA